VALSLSRILPLPRPILSFWSPFWSHRCHILLCWYRLRRCPIQSLKRFTFGIIIVVTSLARGRSLSLPGSSSLTSSSPFLPVLESPPFLF
jgi:hypothetical protein